MTTDEIKRLLQDFRPFGNNDFDNDNESYFYQLTEDLKKNQDAVRAFDDVFSLLERYAEADFGRQGQSFIC